MAKSFDSTELLLESWLDNWYTEKHIKLYQATLKQVLP